jgi:hypothetical protein
MQQSVTDIGYYIRSIYVYKKKNFIVDAEYDHRVWKQGTLAVSIKQGSVKYQSSFPKKVILYMTMFWDVALPSPADIKRRFKGASWIHNQDNNRHHYGGRKRRWWAGLAQSV